MLLPIRMRSLLLGGLICLLCIPLHRAAAQAGDEAVIYKSAAPVSTLTVPAGEILILELETPLHTRATRMDDRAEFVTSRDLIVGRHVAIPKGAKVRATVTESKRPGRIKGRGRIRLHFDEVEFPDGTVVPLSATILRAGFALAGGGAVQEPEVEGEGDTARDVMVVVQGGAQGALIGASVGGGKGAAYGSAIGAGVGLLGMLLRRGPDLDLARGTLFEVELIDPLVVPVSATRQLGVRRAAVSTPNDPTDLDNFRFPGPDEEEAVAAEEIPDFEETEVPEGSAEQPSPGDSVGTDPASASAPAAVPASEPAPSWKGPAPPDDTFTIRRDVGLVVLEAVVRDPAGRAMDHLTREDFRLSEDGAEQNIRHFSRDELPLALAMVVDRSGSVAPFMRELRRAAYQTLGQLKSGDQVALFGFASRVKLLEGLTTDRRRVAERIARIRPGGGTNIIDALFEAADYLERAAPGRRRAIILISDNQHTVRAENSVETLLRFALETETVVYSVRTPGENSPRGLQIPLRFGKDPVKEIAKETGGEVMDVRRQGSLAKALEAVISRLKLRYTIGYVSSNKSRDGRFRRVEIRLADRFGEDKRNYAVHHRRGYYAVPDAKAAESRP